MSNISYANMRAFRRQTVDLESAVKRHELAAQPPCIEAMAQMLAYGIEPATGRAVCLNSRDAPLIFLATMMADRDLNFFHAHVAVSRALEIRRDAVSEIRADTPLSDHADGAGPARAPTAGPASEFKEVA